MPIATVNGKDLYYEDSGGRGPAVVFSHGFALDHTLWSKQVEALSPVYRCITWDSPGQGMSEENGRYSEWDLADDIAGLLDQVGVERAVAVGQSQGGYATFCFGIRHGDRAAALALVDTSAVPQEGLEAFRQMGATWCSTGPVGELADGFAALQFGPDWPGNAAWVGKWQYRPPSSWRVAWESILGQEHDLVGRIGEIGCPTLVIHGTADAAISYPDIPRLTAGALADCRALVAIEGAPHASPATHPQEVNVALRSFLADVFGSAA